MEVIRLADASEHWESLEVLGKLLHKSLDLHRNGSIPVKMTEQSLYNLLAADCGDILEITVSKAKDASPTVSENRGSLAEYPERDWRKVMKTSICGNCGRRGHIIRDCIGPVDDDGEIDGCPKCNAARSHMYDDCPLRDPDEDFDFIYRYRQRKPPIKSFMAWTSFLGDSAIQKIWPTFIPWSASFSLEQQDLAFRAHRPPEWLYYDYDQIGGPDLEARSRLVDPEFEFMML